MTTTADQLSVVLSGGSANIDPNLSLGGEPSAAPVTDASLNNLFDDISEEEAEAGHEDYRCFYFFNDGDTTVFTVKVWIYEDFEDGCGIEIGVEERNETQRVTVTGSPTGGDVSFIYASHNFTVVYDSDLAVWATNFQEALDELEESGKPLLRDVTVTAATGSGGIVIFDLIFATVDGKKDHDKLLLDENNLTGTDVEVSITVVQEGAPVNTIAPVIDLETTPPGGVNFYAADESSPIILPKLRPDEGFPLWVKRVAPIGVESKENDGFTLRFSAQSYDPEA